MRKKTRVGKGAHWQMRGAEKPSLNSANFHDVDNSKENNKTETLKRKLLRGKPWVESRVIYSKKGLSQGNMLAVDQGDSKGKEHEEAEEAQFSEEAIRMAERVHRPIGTSRNLAARRENWASEGVGEAIYTYTLWIMGRKGNDSTGSEINRMSKVEAELDIPMGDKGGDWETISIAQWRGMKDQFILHVLVIPIAICEILMGWNQGVKLPRQKLRIGSTGNAGDGDPSINALWGCDRSKSGKQFHRRSEEGLI